jgi:hypothetical protein
MDLLEMDNVDPFKHWYYLTKFNAVKYAMNNFKLKGYKVLDVGAGSGYFTEKLILNDFATSGLCIDVNYKKRYKHKKLPIRYEKICQIEEIETAQIILFMDVLEHVKSDAKLLIEYVEKSKPGTIVVITVPAFQTLWSGHDEYLGHLRRYKIEEVERVIMNSGLKLHSISYLFGSIFPIVWVVRKIKRKKVESGLVNNHAVINYLLTKVLNFEHRFLKNRLFGTSVLAVCKV